MHTIIYFKIRDKYGNKIMLTIKIKKFNNFYIYLKNCDLFYQLSITASSD